MAFNSTFLSQLGQVPVDLGTEILQILKAATEPLTTKEIFNKSTVAVTSRDVSLELVRVLQKRNLVEIDSKGTRPGTASPIAWWKLTPQGIEFIETSGGVVDSADVDEEEQLPEETPQPVQPALSESSPSPEPASPAPVVHSAPAVETIAPKTDQSKSKVRLLQEHLAQHRSATSEDLSKIAGPSGAKPFLKSLIDGGLIIFTSGKGLRGSYSLPENVTLQDLLDYTDYKRKSAGKNTGSANKINDDIPLTDEIIRVADVLQEVIVHPGIKRTVLFDRFLAQTGNRKQVLKAISNCIDRKKITEDEEGGLHLGEKAGTSVRRMHKATGEPKKVRPGKIVSLAAAGEVLPDFSSTVKAAPPEKPPPPASTPEPEPETPPQNVVHLASKRSAASLASEKPDENFYGIHQGMIDAKGQLVVQQGGHVRLVLSPEDTIQLQKLFLAINLEAINE